MMFRRAADKNLPSLSESCEEFGEGRALARGGSCKFSSAVRPKIQRPKGSIIVAVLVVLFIVALMSTQTFQSLWLMRHGDAQRRSIHQARELVELGKIALRQQNLSASDASPITVELAENETGEISFEVVSSAAEVEDKRDQPENAGASEQATAVVRIQATFPAGTDREVTATWQGRL